VWHGWGRDRRPVVPKSTGFEPELRAGEGPAGGAVTRQEGVGALTHSRCQLFTDPFRCRRRSRSISAARAIVVSNTCSSPSART
jgi:hypothetical protein